MEEKLTTYRRRTYRKQIMEKAKKFVDVSQWLSHKPRVIDSGKIEEETFLIQEEKRVTDILSDDESIPDCSSHGWDKQYIIFSIFTIIIWLLALMLAIHVQFAAVFICISILIFICMNTRTGQKQEGEISAYSVFNENCEPIDGALNAEQLEKEIKFGMLT